MTNLCKQYQESLESSKLKQGRNIAASDTSPFPLMMNQMTPLVSQGKDKSMQMYTQKYRTDKHDLHDAQVK